MATVRDDVRINRSATLMLLALLVGGFGIYAALNGIALLAGGGTPFLAVTMLAQGILGLVAAYGVARAQSWAPAVVLLLALLVAATALVEAFVLGILPWLYALFIAIAALVLALIITAMVGRTGGA
jgi:hypothetical protein